MKIRRCGFENTPEPESPKPVWARRNVTTARCPKSVITADSLTFIEQFQVWKRFGCTDVWSMNARTAEALSILEDQWQKEIEIIRKTEGA